MVAERNEQNLEHNNSFQATRTSDDGENLR